MQHRKIYDWKAWAPAALAGGAAGLVNGFFGGGGGMLLVPLLAGKCGLERRSAFASSVAIILPLCALSAVIYFARGQLELLHRPPLSPGWPAGRAGGREALSQGPRGVAAAGLCAGHFLRGLESPDRMTAWVIALLAGGATGILSAFGIGGGSLLLIYLTSFAALDQHQAQGINLLYFLPAAAAALPAHHKNGLLEKKAILPAIFAGLAAAGLAAWISTGLDTRLLAQALRAFSAVRRDHSVGAARR